MLSLSLSSQQEIARTFVPRQRNEPYFVLTSYLNLQYLLNKRCGTECVVQRHAKMLVEVREDAL